MTKKFKTIKNPQLILGGTSKDGKDYFSYEKGKDGKDYFVLKTED